MRRARIAYAGQWLTLTRYEYLILKTLLEQPERVFSRARIMDRAWQEPEVSLERAVDTHIKTLRAKLHKACPDQNPIVTHRGLGYSVSGTVRADGQITGVLTVGKPSVAVQPFIEAALRNVRERGIWVMLAAIEGAAELLAEDMPRQQQVRFINNIHNESRRLGQVVEQMLGLAALEKRRGLEQIETIDVTALVRRLLEAKSALALSKGLKLGFSGREPVTALGEAFLLQQAISNLLDNAIEFSPAGASIEVALQSGETHWTLCIRDHGPGIPDYAGKRLFERFYSLPRPENGRRSSGLGLSLVSEVVSLHGGAVLIDNHPEGGARAHLRLPLQPQGSPAQGRR